MQRQTRPLERFLPEAEQRELEALPPLAEEISPERFSNGDILEKVHWSWFLPTLKLYPESEQQLFLSALEPQAEKHLAKALTLSVGNNGVSEVGKSFLRHILLSSLTGPKDQMLPMAYLPASKLKCLLSFTKKELTQLIDRLSLYDLAMELRQIVETKILQKIYSFLTDDEKQFLKIAATQKEPYTTAQIHLEKWDGTKKSFRLMLHRIGLARLGGSPGRSSGRVWYH